MKTKILSMLLTVAMLVAMVPMFTVGASAAETGTVYEVSDAASITALIADTTKNVAGNTMKLTQDLTYEASTESLWKGLNANVDGNGHKVTLTGESYAPAILFTIKAGSADDEHSQKVENLAVVTTQQVSVADQKLSLFGQVNGTTIAQASYTTNYVNLEVNNCYFNVNLNATTSNKNTGTAILISRIANNSVVFSLSVTNCFFKGTLKANGSNATGALVGRRYNANDVEVDINIKNCVFDVNSAGGTAVAYISEASTNLNFTGNNLVLQSEKVALAECEITGEEFLTYVKADDTNTVTTVKGYQTTKVTENKFDLRLVGLVDVENSEELANYSKVGFVVVANYANTNTKWTSAASNKVYESLKGYEGETGLVTYEAPEGDYLYALAIKNVPADAGDITFEVTPYYIKADGTTVYGATMQFTVVVSELPVSKLPVSKLPDNTVNAAA